MGCGFTFYMGTDNNPPAGQIDLFTVVLHELGHGLGFSTPTNGATGTRLGAFDSKYDTFLFDLTQAIAWPAMTGGQRATSALNFRKLLWTEGNVTGATPTMLNVGMVPGESAQDVAIPWQLGLGSSYGVPGQNPATPGGRRARERSSSRSSADS